MSPPQPQHLIRNQSDGVVNSNIKLLRDQNQFFDVSLVCEDGARLSAHKVILAAHSDRFRQILEQMSSSAVQTPVSHCCVYLTGVWEEDLTNILDYIYEGEAKVSSAALARFLSVAEILHINSLVNIDNSDNVSKKPENADIEEEVYLASKGQNAVVEQVLPKEDDKKGLRPPSNKPEVVSENKSKVLQESSPPTDVNKVLLDNLKVLGLSKISKDILKDPKSRKYFKKIMSKPTPKLPCPLEFMNGPQLSSWLVSEFQKDFIEQGKAPRASIPWGAPDYRPRCWPEAMWPWHLVGNLGHKQTNKPAHVNIQETLKMAVKTRLRHLNIDPETFVSEDYTEEQDKRKKMIRGIKVAHKSIQEQIIPLNSLINARSLKLPVLLNK